MPDKNILITGCSGQLGKQFKLLESKSKNNFFYTNKYDLDITQYNDVKKYINDYKIDIIINCAAFTDVDSAESKSKEAFLVNQQGCKNLAKVSSKQNLKIVHISSDYVFEGNHDSFLDENHPTKPLSEYGKSKLAGEKEFIKCNTAKYLIIRSGWLYSYHGKNFMNTIIKLLKNNSSIKVISNQYGTPTSCEDLVHAIYKIIENKDFNFYAKKGSIYHFSNSGYCSWYEYAVQIKKNINSECDVIKINSDQYKSIANRPKSSILKITKIINDFDLEIIPWEEALKKVLKRR